MTHISAFARVPFPWEMVKMVKNVSFKAFKAFKAFVWEMMKNGEAMQMHHFPPFAACTIVHHLPANGGNGEEW